MYGSPKTQRTLLQKARCQDRAFLWRVENDVIRCVRVDISAAD